VSKTRLWAGGAVAVCVLAFAILAAVVAALRPPAVAVADVRGTSVAHARSVLATGDLRAEVISHADERVPGGSVIAEKPAPGSALHRGDRVALYVSSGLPLVAIPNVVGISFQSAVRRLRPVKLRIRYAAAFSQASANSVIEQVPPAGTRVREGSNAIVIISTGGQPQIHVSSDDGSN